MASSCYLTHIDPSRNMARYYHMTIQPTLLGEWSLVREWGRIGKGGQVKQASFSSAEEARQAFTRLAKAKQRRGYW